MASVILEAGPKSLNVIQKNFLLQKVKHDQKDMNMLRPSEVLWESLRKGDHLEEPGVDGRIILK